MGRALAPGPPVAAASLAGLAAAPDSAPAVAGPSAARAARLRRMPRAVGGFPGAAPAPSLEKPLAQEGKRGGVSGAAPAPGPIGRLRSFVTPEEWAEVRAVSRFWKCLVPWVLPEEGPHFRVASGRVPEVRVEGPQIRVAVGPAWACHQEDEGAVVPRPVFFPPLAGPEGADEPMVDFGVDHPLLEEGFQILQNPAAIGLVADEKVLDLWEPDGMDVGRTVPTQAAEQVPEMRVECPQNRVARGPTVDVLNYRACHQKGEGAVAPRSLSLPTCWWLQRGRRSPSRWLWLLLPICRRKVFKIFKIELPAALSWMRWAQI